MGPMARGVEAQQILCERLLVYYVDTKYMTAQNSILYVPYIR